MQLNLQDQMLKVYIDKIFDKYDTDKSGTLDQDQLTNFFNDLFKELGMQINVTKEQSLQAIKSIDQNSDGGVDKKELFDAFKLMMNKPQQQTGMYNSYPPPQQYNQPYSNNHNPYHPVQHNPYGIQNPYSQPPPGYNPYQQSPYYPGQYNQGPYNQGPYNQGPYGGYQGNYNPNQYNGYNQYNNGGMGGSVNGGSVSGGRWGKMQ